MDPAWGAQTKLTDPNKKVTESQYDALGRITKVWLPDSLRSLGKSPNYTYAYSITASDLPWVSTSTIKGDGSGYNTTYEIYDSLLRTRQVQTPSPVGGTIVAETLYDDRGLAVTAEADIYDESASPSGTLVEVDGGQAPTETDTTYDGAGRATKAVTKNYGVTRWWSGRGRWSPRRSPNRRLGWTRRANSPQRPPTPGPLPACPASA
jgi:YD repeat-containing protein